MNEIEVSLNEISRENIADYGTLIDTGDRPADFSSEVFSYWDGLDAITAEGRVSFGILESYPGPLVAVNMERHTRTTETIIPLDGDIILVLCRPTDEARADLDSAAAFRIPAGKAVTLKTGTWHYVPLVADRPVKAMIVFRAGTPNDDLFVDEIEREGRRVIRVTT